MLSPETGALETAFPFSVGQLNRYLKELLSLDDLLCGVWLRGEASNVSRHASGHLYFTLKDEDGQLSCVMWQSDARRLRFPVETGAQYLAYGQVTMWEKQGKLQFVADHLEPDGKGALHVAYERLKKRLHEEGLFDEDRKRPLPFIPRRVGLVTSPTGAAVHDMIRILRELHPRLDLVILPALVQGESAPESIAAAVRMACRVPGVDVLIVGRGGGSAEDLWAFNDERVVRAVAECEVPVVTAIGHETDLTLSDFAADVRAPTPTAAAQIVAPPVAELRGQVTGLLDAASLALRRRLSDERRRVQVCLDRAAFAHPLAMTARHRSEVERHAARLEGAMQSLLYRHRQRALAGVGKLDALSPLGVLARGYALVQKEGRVVHSATQVRPGEAVDVRLSDGELHCEVNAVTWTRRGYGSAVENGYGSAGETEESYRLAAIPLPDEEEANGV
ncbi:MAG: exodeoxyribonuclease VII large subunit [Armatimonadetes bacterium]|nr:exodeoxyribonuclease VII large subunit [Armatimonadota bacterium]